MASGGGWRASTRVSALHERGVSLLYGRGYEVLFVCVYVCMCVCTCLFYCLG